MKESETVNEKGEKKITKADNFESKNQILPSLPEYSEQ